MSVLFSRVNLMSGNKAAIFLVGGVPCSQEDLEGWKAYTTFNSELDNNSPVKVCVETFEYGEGEAFDATPEEVAYIYMRSEKRPDFIEARTKKINESVFSYWVKK